MLSLSLPLARASFLRSHAQTLQLRINALWSPKPHGFNRLSVSQTLVKVSPGHLNPTGHLNPLRSTCSPKHLRIGPPHSFVRLLRCLASSSGSQTLGPRSLTAWLDNTRSRQTATSHGPPTPPVWPARCRSGSLVGFGDVRGGSQKQPSGQKNFMLIIPPHRPLQPTLIRYEI